MNGLKYIINISGVKQRELAKELGVSEANLSLLSGSLQTIPNKHLPKLAEIFKVQKHYFRKELTPQDKVDLTIEYFRNNYGIGA